MEIKRIVINKNRGWRGLAEVRCYDSEHNNIKTATFSFSQPVWNDLLKGKIVISDDTHYHVLTFDNVSALPKGQRSVLIKDFVADVLKVESFSKTGWMGETHDCATQIIISNHLKNRNNHTTSDWNCIRNKSSTYDIRLCT